MESDKFYIAQCYDVAKDSPDPRTQNGAILLNMFGSSMLQACNTFPQGVKYKDTRLLRPEKYQYIEHAERGVLLKAARQGIKTSGLTMYVCWYACADCARAIIATGIREVVGHDIPEHHANSDWQESIKAAYEMFDEAGVKYRFITDIIGKSIRFNGEMIDV